MQEERLPRCRIKHIGGKTGALVGCHGHLVIRQDLEGQLAGAQLPCARFGPGQQGLPDPLPPPFAAYRDVVDIEQGLGGKSGKTSETIDQPNRLRAIESQCRG